MNDRIVEDVLIVGGGTAGWMTAAYLIKAFGAHTKITLLEAPSIPRIGVGEATVPNLQSSFFDFLEIPEEEWMREVNGSFKGAVKFIDWRKKAPGEAHNQFYHPFGILPYCDGVHLPQYWFHATRGRGEAFDQACFPQTTLLESKRSPKLMNGQSVYPYAWHFDAQLVAEFLCRWSTARGVAHVRDVVEHVSLGESGEILSVKTKGGQTLGADLFVDCTGFRGLLINEALGEPFIDMSDHLLCDSAVAAQVPHDDAANGIEPYTSAIAMAAGWTWKTPMRTRFGSGYVYSSKFIGADQAVRDFAALWGLDPERTDFNRIRFRTGRNRRSWVKNCISIGLSSCFLEPLESTGIYFITAAIHQLARHFPTLPISERLVERFNREIEMMFDDSRDFVQAHYFTTTRDDTPFWQANRHELVLSDAIQEKVTAYKSGLAVSPPVVGEGDYYRNLDHEFHNFWTNERYYSIFAGMGYLPDTPQGWLSYRPESVRRAKEMLEDVKRERAMLETKVPSSYEYLSSFFRNA